MAKVAVIGGGPAGLLAAREICRRGLDLHVFEEDSEIGSPERCGGLLSLSGLERISAPKPMKYVLNLIRGAIFHSPSGHEFKLDARRWVAAVISRKGFDRMLGEEVEKMGGEISCGVRVRDVERIGESFDLDLGDKRFSADWVIDAEGMSSKLMRKILESSTDRKRWIPIIQLTAQGHGLDPSFVHLYFKEYLPDFFAYLIPLNEEVGRIGIATKLKGLELRMRRFISEEFPRIKVLRRISYAIYVGRPTWTELNERFIPVGDAAGHVKATTGGGVIMGGLISMNMASALSELELGNDPNGYVREARRVYRELKEIFHLRKLIENIPIKFYDEIFKLADETSIGDYLRRFGDMDFQLTSLKKIVHSPRTMMKIISSILLSLLK
ncbi:MAG: NAD(P)/FAD-dependent oxidoreductase [Thaumarchaeota archaeon]|nr:NAD(P)/FAD-dependent oxidoreductase [Nitrososphaerota archaeon]